eukprot:NODE_6631_length_515_cov_39.512887_g6465_i0.p2 GENE.NODE_6631_length_515_cov_39.512887_g6465_i0~~NODE_6631_length_515_cov_39.512887_g6465_i0.p2  ORF type:complete len:152 (-),score=22.39 NODE_6631_length_515_cov_39.512887_g6465_i0:59-457(-)
MYPGYLPATTIVANALGIQEIPVLNPMVSSFGPVDSGSFASYPTLYPTSCPASYSTAYPACSASFSTYPAVASSSYAAPVFGGSVCGSVTQLSTLGNSFGAPIYSGDSYGAKLNLDAADGSIDGRYFGTPIL